MLSSPLDAKVRAGCLCTCFMANVVPETWWPLGRWGENGVPQASKSWVFWSVCTVTPFPSIRGLRSRMANRKVVKMNSRPRLSGFVSQPCLLLAIFFYCRVTNYHQVSILQQHTFIIPVSMVQESGQAQLDALLRVSPGCNPGVGQGYSPCEGQVPFQALVVFGRIHFLLAIEITAALFF